MLQKVLGTAANRKGSTLRGIRLLLRAHFLR
jgi:hypothetical protein